MKKLALILALALSCNFSAAFSVSAETTEAPSVAYTNDIDNDSALSNYLNKTWQQALPTGFTTLKSNGASTENYYLKIDDEHGYSWGFKNAQQVGYAFGGTILGKAVISFDILNNGTTNGYWNIAPNGREWNTTNWDFPILSLKDKKIVDRNGNKVLKEIEYNEWHRIDLVINGAEEGTTIERYIDGVRVDEMVDGQYVPWTGKGAAVNSIAMFGTDGDFSVPIYVDNLRFMYQNSADSAAITNAIAVTAKQSEGEVSLKLGGTINPDTVPAEFSVAVQDAVTGATVTENIPVETDTTNTKIIFDKEIKRYDTWTITIPETVKGIDGASLAATSVSITGGKVWDMFEDFEEYSAGSNLRTGLWYGDNFNTAVTRFPYAAGTQQYTGKSMRVTNNNRIGFHLPSKISSGKLLASFDAYVDFNGSWFVAEPFLGDTWTYNFGFQIGKTGNVKQGWSADLANIGTDKKWRHFDMLFDYDAGNWSVFVDGVQVMSTANYGGSYAVKSYPLSGFGIRSNGSMTADIDNVHMRYYGTNEVTTDFIGTVDPSKTTGYLKFEDAVIPSSFKETITDSEGSYEVTYVILTDSKSEEIPVTLSNITMYGADITLNGALKAGETYTLSVIGKGAASNVGIATYSGEELSQSEFKFVVQKPADVFEINDVYVGLNGSRVAAVAAWDNTADYDITAVVNSNVAAKEAVLVAAGYSQTGEMVGIGFANASLTNGNITADLGAVDMTGATKIKLFVLSDINAISPLLQTPVTIQ